MDDKISEFREKFGFVSSQEPRGITLPELYSEMCYLEAESSPFSRKVRSHGGLNYDKMYGDFLRFTDQNARKAPELKRCLFPLFCSAVIDYICIKHTPEVCCTFVSEYIDTIPEVYRSNAEEFFNYREKFQELLPIISNQRFVVQCTEEAATILKKYLNQPQNAELKLIFSESIVLEPLWEDYEPEIVLGTTTTRSMSIIHSKVPTHIDRILGASSNHMKLYCSLAGNDVSVIDCTKGDSQKLYDHGSFVTSLSISSVQDTVVSVDMTGYMHASSQDTQSSVRVSHMPLWCCQFAPVGGMFAVGGKDTLVRLYDVSRIQKPYRILAKHAGDITDVQFHPNCALLGTVGVDHGTRIWDLRTAEPNRVFPCRPYACAYPCFSTDGKLYAYFDGILHIGDIGSGDLIKHSEIPGDVISVASGISASQFILTTSHGCVYRVDAQDDEEAIKVVDFQAKIVFSQYLSSIDELFVVTRQPSLQSYRL